MFIKSALFFTSTALLLGAAFPTFAMEEESSEEKLKTTLSKSSPLHKIDIKQFNLTIAPPQEKDLLSCRNPFSFLKGWDDENKNISTILYKGIPQQDPSVKEYINIIDIKDTHIIFGKKSQFALVYNKNKDETVFFSRNNDSPGMDIVKIMQTEKKYLYVELENGWKEKIKPDGREFWITEEEKNFKEVENLPLSQQMERINSFWKPLNKEKNIFYTVIKENIYLSQIVDKKLHLFSPRKDKTFSGQFIPLSYTPITSKTLPHGKENDWRFKYNFYEEERRKGEGTWVFASKNQILSFWEELRNACELHLLSDLKDIDLKIEEVVPKEDKNSQFILYGDNESVVIKNAKSFNNIPIAELEKIMAPDLDCSDGIHRSISGFLGENEKLLEVMVNDNNYVRDLLKLTHRKLADPLKRIVKALDKWISRGTPFLFHGNIYMLLTENHKGMQFSPFHDKNGTFQAFILYNLSTGELLTFSPLVPFMIEKFGFYEGDTPYRLDPEAIWQTFPESAFEK